MMVIIIIIIINSFFLLALPTFAYGLIWSLLMRKRFSTLRVGVLERMMTSRILAEISGELFKRLKRGS